MLQDILAEPEWHDALTTEDKRGLTALFWAHVRPYGEITLNMTNRLAISQPPPTQSDDGTARTALHAPRNGPGLLGTSCDVPYRHPYFSATTSPPTSTSDSTAGTA